MKVGHSVSKRAEPRPCRTGLPRYRAENASPTALRPWPQSPGSRHQREVWTEGASGCQGSGKPPGRVGHLAHHHHVDLLEGRFPGV